MIREMTPERIFTSLTTGSMQMQSEGLNDGQKRVIAEFMSGRTLGSAAVGDAKNMPNKCPSNPAMTDPARTPAWNGWSADMSNTRFQTAQAAALTAAQVPQLKLKWAFGLPAGMTSSSQPTVVSGRVFVGGDNGFIYSMDAATGCVYWSFENGAIVRGAVTVGPVSGQGASRYAVYFGDGRANVFAVDAQSGKQLWKTKVDSHVVARISAATKLYNGTLIVPVSSSEEFASGNVDYPCCTSRGSIVALEANTGKQVWKYWVVEGEPKAVNKNPNGVQIYAPAGGSVWNSPTIDPVRGAIYFGTGDATTAPSPLTTDAIVAIDIKTGKLLWNYQADANDVFMGGCNGAPVSLACPTPNGPDLDIGNSPILASLPNGKRVLLTGTKRGHLIALDPDNKGALLYRLMAATGMPPVASTAGAGRGGGGGSIVWGGAADAQNAYYGLGGTGLVALKPDTGQPAWTFVAPAGGGGLGAAPTVIPGVVFEASANGRLYAVSTADGKQLWEFNTNQEFQTVNKVAAHGGAISVSGASVAGGMVFISSGYAISSGASAGNVVLAFSIN
jgi:polyvinyl alcohol dehydrogenase (cytochrome)